ncbi:putative holin-like toxin [Paenibacillus elgii]|uniref:putative holin-like toxin n=1 Tax=Paenibacillus elgii TaxID=189691 RepID=UPI00294FF8D2|nr:putative holin-like toxin [Paenibacillus elgii]
MYYRQTMQCFQGKHDCILPRGGGFMEIKDTLTLMFMFGMFICALLNYIKKK